MKKLLTVMLSVLLAITTITFNVTAQENTENIQQEQVVEEVLEQEEGIIVENNQEDDETIVSNEVENQINNEEVEQIEAAQLLGAAPEPQVKVASGTDTYNNGKNTLTINYSNCSIKSKTGSTGNNSTATITIEYDDGYEFDSESTFSVSDGTKVSQTETSVNVKFGQNKNATLTIAPKQIAANVNVTLAVNNSGYGSIVDNGTQQAITEPKQVSSGTTFTTNGAVLTIGGTSYTATPASGYQFDSWSETSGTISEDKTITATFKASQPAGNEHNVTIATGILNGTITTDATDNKAAKDATVTITASPASNYKLSTLVVSYGDGQTITPDSYGNENEYVFTMPDADVTINATFEQLQNHNIVISDSIENGTVSTGVAQAKLGDSVVITASPSTDYELKTLVVSYGSKTITPEATTNENEYEFVMPDEDVTINAEFGLPAPKYDITITDCTNGSVTVDALDNKAEEDATVTITVTPDSGYAIDTMSVIYDTDETIDTVAKVGNKFEFTMPAEEVTITVTFKALAKKAVTYSFFKVSDYDKTNRSVKSDAIKLCADYIDEDGEPSEIDISAVVNALVGSNKYTYEKYGSGYDFTANTYYFFLVKKNGGSITETGLNYKDGSTTTIVVKNKDLCNDRDYEVFVNLEAIEYDITYYYADGTTEIDDARLVKTYTCEDEIELPNLEKDGFTFKWYSDDTLTTEATKIEEGSSGDKSFYGVWTPIENEDIPDDNNLEITVKTDDLNEAYIFDDIDKPTYDNALKLLENVYDSEGKLVNVREEYEKNGKDVKLVMSISDVLSTAEHYNDLKSKGGFIFDIVLDAIVDYGGERGEETYSVKETPYSIKIVVQLLKEGNEELIKELIGENKVYIVGRYHGDDYEEFEVSDMVEKDDSYEFTFYTDKFSEYVIYSKDKPLYRRHRIPNTGVNGVMAGNDVVVTMKQNPTVKAIGLLMMCFGIYLAFEDKRRK